MTDADSGKNPERYPIGTVIIIGGRYAGEVIAHASEEDESYLVYRVDGALGITNREKMELPGVELAWD